MSFRKIIVAALVYAAYLMLVGGLLGDNPTLRNAFVVVGGAALGFYLAISRTTDSGSADQQSKRYSTPPPASKGRLGRNTGSIDNTPTTTTTGGTTPPP